MGKGRPPSWGPWRLCWCFTGRGTGGVCRPFVGSDSGNPLLQRVPSMLYIYLLGHPGHQLASTNPLDSDFRSQTSLGGRWHLGLSCSLED